MKSIPTTFIILLGLAATYAVSGTTRKGSTVLDYLKDGFDTVYKYKETSTFSHNKLKDVESVSFDVLLRKSSQDDEFAMHFEKAMRIIDAHDKLSLNTTFLPTPPLLLPLIVRVEKPKLNLEHLYATETDTKKSLDWKYDALKLMLHNMTEDVKDYNDVSDSFEVEVDGDEQLFGKCKLDFSVKTNEVTTVVEFVTKRDRCTGPLDKKLLKAFEKYGAIDVHGDTKLHFGYNFERTTKQFLKGFVKVEGRLVSAVETTFSMITELRFDSFKEIQENVDLAENLKLYKESDFE